MIPELTESTSDRDERILVRARMRAKEAWTRAQQDDDATRRAASEARLIAQWPRPRVLPVRAFALGAAATACVAALALAIVRGNHDAPSAKVAPAAASTGNLAVAVAPASASASPVVGALRTSRGVVTQGACPDCRVGGVSLEPGAPVALGQAVSVPRGSRLTLGFGLPGALVDPTTGIDLEGPAVASATDDHSIALDRGSARFRGLRDITLSVPGGRLVGENATFTVFIDNRGISHVAVERGRVVVTSTLTRQTQTLDAGAALALPSAPAPEATAIAATSVTPATSEAPTSPREPELDAVASAQTRFRDGETAAARSELETLAHSGDASVARRATFTLAEIEMASGERDKGRARLQELATCPDPKLGADATTLLARTEPTPAGRAATWARYLATSPPAGYRERALLERAEALLDAGHPEQAKAIVTDLRPLALSDTHKRHLERLSFKLRDLRAP